MSAQLNNGKLSKAQISDWSDIHFAFQVARLGTLSAAAEVLNVHHSTVFRRIDALERRLNTRLFHRHPRGYTPTDAGQLLLSTALRTQEEFDRLLGQLAGADDQISGTVIVTTVNTLSAQLTPLLAQFQQLYPEIRIEFVVDPRLFKLEYGEAHISLRPGAKPKDPDYIVQHLCTLKNTLYASDTYIKKHGRMKNLEDIEGHRFISNISHLSNVPFIDWLHCSVPAGQIYYRASDFISMAHAAEAHLGITPAGCLAMKNNDHLEPILEPPEEWNSELWLVSHRNVHRTPKVQALSHFLKKALKLIE